MDGTTDGWTDRHGSQNIYLDAHVSTFNFKSLIVTPTDFKAVTYHAIIPSYNNAKWWQEKFKQTTFHT